MSSILISNVRISGFRGLKDVQLSLSKTTVLTGCNNVGKTSVLKALQLALGSNTFLTQDDLNISGNEKTNEIIIDLKIVPVDDKDQNTNNFSDDWESVFTTDCIQIDSKGSYFVGLRTKYTYSTIKSDFEKKTEILSTWEPDENQTWQEITTTPSNFKRDSIPFYYIEAQRDIVDDIKLRTSFLGKMLSDVTKSYPSDKIKEIEKQIENLNETTIINSDVLSSIQKTLEGIESAIDYKDAKVKITPFTKKIRDLNKGLSIQYGNEENSFTMDYHGMGTRSWSSLLTFKSFILHNQATIQSSGDDTLFFPIITVEEPEAHLHPNAQKKLYSQIKDMPGQKIISTHSPYIAASAELCELRSLYKNNDKVTTGQINLSELDDENKRRLKQKVLATKGEIIFSRALVFFEGETEEQALPIFAESFFCKNPMEYGINFVGVGGCGNYLPFLRLAESFNIPWYIFSDGESKAKDNVLSAIKKIKSASISDLSSQNNVFVINNNADFERMLINEDFIKEIENGLKSILGNDCINEFIKENQGKQIDHQKTSRKCPTCKQYIYTENIKDYKASEGYNIALDDIMAKNKTSCAPVIADEIIKSGKALPSPIKKMFEKIKEDLSI